MIYRRTQFDWKVPAAIGGLLMGTVAGLSLLSGSIDWISPVTIIFVVTSLIPSYLYSSLTVEVTEEAVRWGFRKPLQTHSLDAASIRSVEVADKPRGSGIGVQNLMGTYHVYALWSPDAVRIRQEDGPDVYLGSDEPDRLADALREIQDAGQNAPKT